MPDYSRGTKCVSFVQVTDSRGAKCIGFIQVTEAEMVAALTAARWLYHVTHGQWHKPDRSTAAMTTREAYAMLMKETGRGGTA